MRQACTGMQHTCLQIALAAHILTWLAIHFELDFRQGSAALSTGCRACAESLHTHMCMDDGVIDSYSICLAAASFHKCVNNTGMFSALIRLMSRWVLDFSLVRTHLVWHHYAAAVQSRDQGGSATRHCEAHGRGLEIQPGGVHVGSCNSDLE